MTTDVPMVPLSWGELFDKISILHLKQERFTGEAARREVAKELALLTPLAAPLLARDGALTALAEALKAVNAELWDIENHIRECEAAKRFDAQFIALARGVYRTNDRRSALKRQINLRAGSAIVEQKEYSDYGGTSA